MVGIIIIIITIITSNMDKSNFTLHPTIFFTYFRSARPWVIFSELKYTLRMTKETQFIGL